MAHPPLLEVDRLLTAGALALDDDVGLDRGVGHRQQRDAELGQPPAGREAGDDLAQRHTAGEELGAVDVGRDVLVAEREPLGGGAEGGELGGDGVTLVGPTPPLTLVHAATEGVEDRVEVGADPQAEERDVVTGVADDGQLDGLGGLNGVGGPGGGGDAAGGARGTVLEVAEEATEEAGPAHASGQGGDAHGTDPLSPRHSACPQVTVGRPAQRPIITVPLDVRRMTRM